MANQSFGELLRSYRISAGIGLRRYSELIGELPANLSAIEHGRRKPPQSKEKLRNMADVLGLTEGTTQWDEFFDAAASPGKLPADIEHLADRKLVPALLRTVDGMRLSDAKLEELVEFLNQSWRSDENGSTGTAGVQPRPNRSSRKKAT